MRYFIFIWILCQASKVFAITDPGTGIVIDSRTKDPLPFTNIIVLGQNRGSISNSEGYFVLDLDSISPSDTILFSFMGYKTLRIKASKIRQNERIRLQRASINLDEVEVRYKAMNAREIVAMADRNFKKNHPPSPGKQELFYHKFTSTPFPGDNKFELIQSDFVGLDQQTFDEIFSMMPPEFIEYQDAEVELYSYGKDHKLLPRKGVSLEEQSMESIGKEMEEKLGDLFEDIQKSREDEDVYYKIRSGMLAHKFKRDTLSDIMWEEYINDTLNYTVETKLVRDEITTLFEEFASRKNWEFLTDRSKYEYEKGEMTTYGDELVYRISFSPEKRGLFLGEMYISTSSFAILQLDFAFAEGKTDEKFSMFGFSHRTDFKSGRVVFERGESGYFVKYINAGKHEFASVSRGFSVMKMQKRPLRDKQLNQIEMEVQMEFDIQSAWELLVLNREEYSGIGKIEQPLFMKFRKEYAYTPEMWNEGTVIMPAAELKKYTRQ